MRGGVKHHREVRAERRLARALHELHELARPDGMRHAGRAQHLAEKLCTVNSSTDPVQHAARVDQSSA
jgi:hypothetical protein